MPQVIEGSVECRSCSEKYPVRYRLDEPAAGPITTTARRCPRCDTYMDVPIVAGGYFLELAITREVAFEARLLETAKQCEWELEREKQAAIVHLTPSEEWALVEAQIAERYWTLDEPLRAVDRRRSLIKRIREAQDRVALLDAEIAKASALLDEIGNVDPADEPGFYITVVDRREDVRWMIRVREALLAKAPLLKASDPGGPMPKITAALSVKDLMPQLIEGSKDTHEC